VFLSHVVSIIQKKNFHCKVAKLSELKKRLNDTNGIHLDVEHVTIAKAAIQNFSDLEISFSQFCLMLCSSYKKSNIDPSLLDSAYAQPTMSQLYLASPTSMQD